MFMSRMIAVLLKKYLLKKWLLQCDARVLLDLPHDGVIV